MKVSILIPTLLKRKEWLGQAFQSAVNQTLAPYEILLSNACNITGEVNGNHLMAQAKGDLFLFLSDDDYLEPTFLEQCVKKMQESGADIVSTAMRMFTENTESCVQPRPWTREQMQAENPIWFTSLFTRKVYEKVGDYDNSAGYADWDFWWRAFDAGFKCATIPDALFNYRLHPNQHMGEIQHQNARNSLLKKHKIL